MYYIKIPFSKFLFLSPLVTDHIFSMYGKNFNLKKEGIIEKISYERRAYESVDDSNHF